MEFKIVEVKSGIAIFNYQELKQQLQEKLNDYKGYLVTNENLTQAKSDRALLNKVKKAINDERIKVKNEVLKLYNETFEPQCKELTSLVDDVVTSIDNQIKAQEEIYKQNKKMEVKDLFNSVLSDIDFIPNPETYFELVWNEKWLNKTYSLEDIRKDLEQGINQVKNDLSVIEMTIQNEVDKAEVKVEYFKNMDLSVALKEFNDRKQLKEKVFAQPSAEAKTEEVVAITIKVKDLKSKVLKLAEFLKANNINYEQIQ